MPAELMPERTSETVTITKPKRKEAPAQRAETIVAAKRNIERRPKKPLQISFEDSDGYRWEGDRGASDSFRLGTAERVREPSSQESPSKLGDVTEQMTYSGTVFKRLINEDAPPAKKDSPYPPVITPEYLQARIARIERKAPGLQEQQRLFAEEVRQRAEVLGIPESMAQSLGDRWFLIDRLGRGGMGEVYDAYDLRLRQPAVVKFTIAEKGTISDETRRRFDREKKALASFASNHIVRAFDAGQGDEGMWMAMEKIEGESLHQQIRNKPFSQAQAVNAAQQIAEGMTQIHKSNRIFRDLKPDNVMYDRKEGQYKVIDFGLVKDLEQQRDRSAWLENAMRELLSGQRKLDELKISAEDRKRLRELMVFIKDDQIRQHFVEGKLQIADFDEGFQRRFADLAGNVKFIKDGNIELLMEGARHAQALYLGRQFLGILGYGRHETLPVEVLKSSGSFLQRLKRDPDLLVLLQQRRFDEAEHYIAAKPEMKSLSTMMVEHRFQEDLTGDTIVGTPKFMSPEQINNTDQVDDKTDIWALGVTMYEMLSGGTSPFDDKSVMDVFRRVEQEAPPPLNRPDIDPALRELVMRMLTKDKMLRPSMQEVQAVLKDVAARIKSKPKKEVGLQGFFGDIRKDVNRSPRKLKPKPLAEFFVDMRKSFRKNDTIRINRPTSTPPKKPSLFNRIRRFFGDS